MKYSVTSFKNLEVCIKELKRFIHDGECLETGRPFKQFGGLRSREMLACWLLCVVFSFEQKSNRFRICTDPQGGDGIIYDTMKKKALLTEHILVSRSNNELCDIEHLILKHVEKKQNKGGAAYASGKALIVFLNKAGDKWCPNRVARKLPQQLDFASIWVIGLQRVIEDEYYYNVTKLDTNRSPVWRIKINKNFDAWEVSRIQ